MGAKQTKGGWYEREICRVLTRWWTGDADRDSLWWRSSQSGGRATHRGRKGKSVGKTHCGDICAKEDEGQPLVDLFTIECKIGYRDSSWADMLDRLDKHAEPQFESFLRQAIEASERAGTWAWLLFIRRKGRQDVVFFPARVKNLIGDRFDSAWPWYEMTFFRREKSFDEACPGELVRACGTTLDVFLGKFKPEDVRRLVSIRPPKR